MGTSVSTEGTAPAAGTVSNTMVAGVELGDPVLAENVRDGLAAVETLMVEELSDGEDFLTEAALHLAKAGGKRFRPLFAVLTGQLGQPNDPSIVTAATVVELVHLATLYHDDVMDEATVRRGAPSANVRWGNSVAILAGDYLFAHASRLTSTLGPSAVEVIAKTFAELVTGQMRETIGASEKKDPVEHYLRVVWEKTGSLIAAAAGSAALSRVPTTSRSSGWNASEMRWASPSRSSTTSSTSLRMPPTRARLPAPTCARASTPCRCCTH